MTGIPSSVNEARENKLAWVNKNIGDTKVITCKSKDKSNFMKAGDIIIIDDWDKYQHLWEEKGGHWILHKSAHQSITQLNKLLTY